MDYFFVVLFGLCIGSFLNVCIYRIPREESIAFPPSHCMKCGYELKIKDLVPVFSFLFLKGKCRSCGDKISFQYPMVELCNGILYLSIFLKYGYSLNSIKYMLLVSLMIVIGMIDFKTKYVYTVTTIVGSIIGIIFFIYEWIYTKSFPFDQLIGLLIGGGLIALIVVLTHGMGEGDIEIAAISGFILGVKSTIFMLFSSFILGGIVGIIILALRKKGRKDEMPFGPYLAIGTILAIFIGEQLISTYCKLYLNIM